MMEIIFSLDMTRRQLCAGLLAVIMAGANLGGEED